MQIAAEQTLILGPPGCGKTTESLNIVERELAAGVEPNKIAYVSFTKKAVEEAVERAMARFNYSRSDLPWFRTLHSLAYAILHLRNSDVMQAAHFNELGEAIGYKLNAKSINAEDGFPTDASEGNKLLFVDGLARNRCVTLREQWEELNDYSLDWFTLKWFRQSLQNYKDFHGVMDFTDMLERIIEETPKMDVDVVIIDEAQDLSTLQWEACAVLFHTAKRVYIFADDDQLIYKWAGADVPQLMSLSGKRKVLSQSYRLPRSVHKIACRTIAKVSNRYDKEWYPKDAEGSVDRLPHLDAVSFDNDGTTMILARNGYLLNDTEEMLKKDGHVYLNRRGMSSVSSEHYAAIRAWERLRKGGTVSGRDVETIYAHIRSGNGVQRGFKGKNKLDTQAHYSMHELREKHGLLTDSIWHEALDGIALNTRAYYISVMRRGSKLDVNPRIRISTIHGAKGGEADNVVLLLAMSKRTYQGYEMQQDDEQRVFYVGMTRAKHRLTMVDSHNSMEFML